MAFYECEDELMKLESIKKNQRSSSSGVQQLNQFQLSLLGTLLFNLAMTLCSTTARALEPTLMEPIPLSPNVELFPVASTEQSILNPPSTASVPTVAEVPLAIENINNQNQSVQEIAPAPSTKVLEVAPATQNISTQASDLEGVSTPQNIEQETLAQTENSTPTDSPSDAKDPTTNQSVNNPLIPPPGWQFDFEPYLFLPLDVQGDIFFGRGRNLLFPNRPGVILGNGGINLNVNARLSDVTARLTNIFGVSGRLQAWNGNFGIVSEGLYVNSGFRGSSDGGSLTFRDRFQVPIPGFQIDTQNTISSFALGASYRSLPAPLRTIANPADPNQYYPAISFEGVVGFRYLSVFQSVEFERGPSFEFSGSEINPMLGGTVKLLLSDKFTFFFRGDTSNLGGGNLKQYYNLYAGVDWKFSSSFALRLAYRFNQIEFVKQGRFEGDNGLNLRSQGVQLGLSWQF